MSYKILHIVGKMDRGGAETFIMNVYRNINRKAFKFDFLVHDKAQSKQDYAEEIKELGGKIFYISRISHFIHYLFDLYNFFKKSDHDIVHIHTYVQALFPLLFAKYFGKKVIVHSHNTQFEGALYKKIIKYIITRPLRSMADYYCACSPEAGIWLFGHKIDSFSNFAVIKNGINTEVFSFDIDTRAKYRKKLQIENNLVFGHVGRFEKQKNHEFLIDIFNEVYKKNKNSVLVLIGRGPLEEEIQSKVRKLGLVDVVHFLGIRSDIAGIMNAMDTFIFPSHYEGLGIVLIEAQATGLSCLTSETVPSEAKVTNLCTFLPLSDINSWVKNCLKRYPERKSMSEEIKQSGYHIESSIKKLSDIYVNLIKTK